MILENMLIKILRKDMKRLGNVIHWDGMYNETAKRIVKTIKEELVK